MGRETVLRLYLQAVSNRHPELLNLTDSALAALSRII